MSAVGKQAQLVAPVGASLGARALLVGVALLPVLELLILTLLFDGETLARQEAGPGPWLAKAHIVPQVLVVVCGALWVCAPGRVRESGARLAAAFDAHSRRWGYLAAHAASFALLLACSRVVYDDSGADRLEAAAWFASVLAVLATWMLAIAPGRFWTDEASRQKRLILGAVGVGLTAWTSGMLAGLLWEPLGEATFQLSSRLLRFAYSHVLAEEATRTIHVGDLSVQIARECSGLEGMGLIAVLVAAYLRLFRERHRFPLSLALLPVGVAVMWLANVVRIAALVVIGVELSPAVALQGFHSQAGWIAFTLISVGLIGTASRFPALLVDEAASPGTPLPISETPAYLVPLLAVLAAGMATAAVSAEVDWLYPVRIAAGGFALWWFRSRYRRYWVAPSWHAVGVGLAVFGVWMALEPLQAQSGTPLREGLASMPLGAAALWLAVRVLGSVVLIPIVEEVAFRGYLIRRLTSSAWESLPLAPVALLPALVSSVAFGLLHGRWLAGIVAGLAYAYTLHRRGQLVDPIVAHMTTNGLIAAAALGVGAWGLWM